MNSLSNFSPLISNFLLNSNILNSVKNDKDLLSEEIVGTPEEIFELFCLHTCLETVWSAIPLFTHLPTFLSRLYALDRPYICKELQCSQEEFDYQIFSLMDVFRETRNSTKLINFLKKILMILKKKELPTYLLINTLKTNRLDLFDQPATYFFNPKVAYSAQDRYRIALSNYNLLAHSLVKFLKIISSRDQDYSKKKRAEWFNPFMMPPYEVLREKKFTHPQMLLLRNTLNKISTNLVKEENFFYCAFESLHHDLCENYLPIINSEELNDLLWDKNETSNTKYVNTHKDAYENFLPRVQEIYDVIMESLSSIQRTSLISKDIGLYFIFGDTDKLRGKFGNGNLSYNAVKEFIFEEVTKFSNQISKDGDLQLKIIEFSKKQENHELAMRRLHAGELALQFSDKKNILCWTIKDPLEAAKQFKDDLWIFSRAEIKNSRFNPTTESIERAQNKTLTKETKNPSPLISEAEIDKPMPPIAKVIHNLSFSQQLDNTRLSFRKGFKFLRTTSKSSLYVVEALLNTESHFNNLLCTFNRLYSTFDNLPPRVFHSFAIDCIRYGILAVEQMLSAFDRASNNIKDPNDLKKHLSHNLYRILLSCKFKNISFPQQLRDFIFQIREGEIWLRNLDHCEPGGTSLQNLLYKLKLFEEGKNIRSIKPIFQEILDFSRSVGFLVFHIQKFFLASLSGNKSANSLDEFYKNWENIIKFFKRKEILLAEKSALIISETPIRKTIRCLHEKLKEMGFNKMFENIFNHLLVQLETEIGLSKELKLTELHLHCGNIFLLNQMILEEILQKLIYVFNVSYSFENLHNLWAMMCALGFSEEEFLNSPQEIEFLKSGKDIRQLVRYIATYDSAKRKISNEKKGQRGIINHVDSTLHKTLELSHHQHFAHDEILGDGFQGKPLKENKQKILLKSVEGNLTVMLSILNKLVKKIANP
jgi:hypothetical protein